MNSLVIINEHSLLHLATLYVYMIIGSGNDGGDNDDSDNTVAVAVITFVVTFIVSVTATAIFTFIVAYVCVKRKLKIVNGDISNQSPQEKVLYEQVRPSSHSITKKDLEMQKNPAYSTSHGVIMDTNHAYESCK